MPRLDLILIPLIAGYIFLFTFNLTKYYNIRVERQRLIFNSLICTLFLAFISYNLDYLFLRSNFSIFGSQPISFYRTQISLYIGKVVGENHVVYGMKQSILILLLSYPLGKFLNLVFWRKFAFEYTITRWGNQLDRLFWFSLTEKKDEKKLLMITTKSHKVYIGYVNKISEPLGETYIRIIPNFSGYRNKDDLRIDITTKYTDIIKDLVEKNAKKEIDEKLGIIIPVSEILIVSKFDSEIFGRFNDVEDSQDEPTFSTKLVSGLIDFLKVFKK